MFDLPGQPIPFELVRDFLFERRRLSMMPAMLAQILQGTGLSEMLAASPLLALGIMFGAGVLTSLTPCVYPMIPITASVLAGSTGAEASRSRVIGLTLTYVTGLALLYAVIGLIAGLTGTLFGTVSASPWSRLAIGILLLIFSLAMFEVIPISMPRRWLQRVGGLGGGSYPAVFLLGVTSGVVAAPCGAPVFAVVLTWVAATRAGALGFVYLFVFSLGMTALLVGVGLFSGFATALPPTGPWMVWVKRLAATLMLVMAGYYFILAGMAL